MRLFLTARRSVTVASFAEASEKVLAFTAEQDMGGTEWAQRGGGKLVSENGQHEGYVSYNGKVWLGTPRDWKPGSQPIFDPYAAEAKA